MSSQSAYPNGEDLALSQPLNFKVTHPSQQLARRLRFPTPPAYSTLQAKLVSLWGSSGLTASNLALSYVDQDGDRVVLSSDEELQGFFAELRQRGKEADVVRMRVMVLGEEGGDGGGGSQAGMDVEVEAGSIQEQQWVQQEVEVVATPQAVVERTEDAPMDSNDPFADHSQDANSDFILVDTASEDRRGREISSTPFDDEPFSTSANNNNTSITHEDPPTAMLVDDTGPSAFQAPDPAVAEDEHVDPPVADDPEEVFPPAAEPHQQPSLLNDLSQLLTSITTSDALATILARASQGAYAPNLPIHLATSDIPSQVRSQIDHVRDQLTNGLGDAEGVVAGLAKAFRDGLEQVEQVRRERAEQEKTRAEREKEAGEGEQDAGRAEVEKGREEREQARQIRERAREQAQREREQAQKEREQAQEMRQKAEEEDREARKKDEEERRKAEELRRKNATTSTFGSTYASTSPVPPPPPPPAPAAPRHPHPHHANMFSPPSGPPPSQAQQPSLFSTSHSHHPRPHLKLNQSRPSHPHPHPPQHRHTWGAPGFPGGGMFGGGAPTYVGGGGGMFGGGGAAARTSFENEAGRLRELGSKLDEMGFKEGDYGVVLRRVLGEQGGEWRTDEEVVNEVVRELVMGGM